MEGLRIYYLENLKDDFTILKDEMNEKGIIVYPKNLSQWTLELSSIFKYLKANEEERKQLVAEISSIFKNCNADLFIFDYYLIEHEYKSTTIYNDILKTDEKLADIPVIFLTIEDNDELLPIDRNTGFVMKEPYLSEINVKGTVEMLIKEMEKFPILLNLKPNRKNANVTRINWLKANF